MIEFSHVFFSYSKNNPVITDCSLKLESNTRIALMGASGSGKTTLLRLLMCLETPNAGNVHVYPDLKLSAVFQEDRLLPHLSVIENVSMFSNCSNPVDVLEHLGLPIAVHDEKPSRLSGGMKRRVAIARALCHSFDLLVLDEPFTGLDDHSKRLCIDEINRLCCNKALILSTHDLEDANNLHCICMNSDKWIKV